MALPQQSIDGGPPQWYSVGEVASILGVSEMTVYRAIKTKTLAATKVMGRVLVPARALEQLAEEALETVSTAHAAVH